jgi:hypothetical protein
MTERVNPFASLADPPVFTTKTKTEKAVPTATIERIAEENNFPSRRIIKAKKEPRRKRRVYTTGRNQQFNVRVSLGTQDRFYKLADERGVSICELLELALDALEGAGVTRELQSRPAPNDR